MSKKIQLHSDTLFKFVKGIIDNARKCVAVFLNAETTLLYWQVGNFINIGLLDERRAVYGKQIVATLSQQLTSALEKNVQRLYLRAAESFQKSRLSPQCRDNLSWTHVKGTQQFSNKLHRAHEIATMNQFEKE